jgi:hypothetical protein
MYSTLFGRCSSAATDSSRSSRISAAHAAVGDAHHAAFDADDELGVDVDGG